MLNRFKGLVGPGQSTDAVNIKISNIIYKTFLKNSTPSLILQLFCDVDYQKQDVPPSLIKGQE